jgi:hypothetical protein
MTRSEAFEDYIRKSYEPGDWLAVVRIQRIAGEMRVPARQDIKPLEEVVSESYQRKLRRENSRGSDIYLGVNPVKPDGPGRMKEDIAAIRHLYLDIDSDGSRSADKDGRQAVENALQSGFPPSRVLESSPGRYQVLWRVDGFDGPTAEAANRGLIEALGGDRTVHDRARVLRLPDFRSWKRDMKWWVKDHTHWDGKPLERPAAPYTPGQLSQITEVRLAIEAAQKGLAIDPDDARCERRTGREKERDRGESRDGPDQSRKDFGFAMRKLEEGNLSRQDIVKLIARYRIDHPELERTHHRSEAENWA